MDEKLSKSRQESAYDTWAKSKCACVHPCSRECARRRDGFDFDDPHYMKRDCECACHQMDDLDDDDYL